MGSALHLGSTALSAAVQLGPLAVLGMLYGRRVRTLAESGKQTPGWRQASFYAGLLTIAGALTALGSGSQQLLAIHMAEHLLIGDIAALLIVLGLTGPLIAPVLRMRVFGWLRVLANPLLAFPLWAVDLYVWHVPVFYEAALRSGAVHALEHVMFLSFGVNMWMCLFGPLPTPRWFGGYAKVGYILAVWLAATLLANVFIWVGRVLYPFYASGDSAWRVSPLGDQQIAGGLMMIEGTILILGLFGWLFMRALREAQDRQNLQDFARSRGIVLSEERAARAVRAGRAADLRRRLEETDQNTLTDTGRPSAR